MSAKKASVLLKLVVVLVLLGAAGAAVVWFLRPVAKVAAVARGDTANIVTGSVVVEAGRVSPITSDVEGRVKETNLAPGQQVKENDVLVQLDTTDIDLQITQAKAELEGAKANQAVALKTAELTWTSKQEDMDTAEREFKASRMAPVAIEKARREFEIAKQARAKAEADDKLRVATLDHAVQVKELDRKKMTICAPFDGQITTVDARNKDIVGAQQLVAHIIDRSRLVKAKISGEKFPLVEVGQKAKVTLLGYGTSVFAATVTQKLPAAEANTQRYVALLKVDIPDDQLLADLTGEVGITIDEHKNVVRVPRVATWDGFVFVVEGGRAVERKIDPGYQDFNFVEVKSGLKEGETIIVDETDRFLNGQRVRTQTAP